MRLFRGRDRGPAPAASPSPSQSVVSMGSGGDGGDMNLLPPARPTGGDLNFLPPARSTGGDLSFLPQSGGRPAGRPPAHGAIDDSLPMPGRSQLAGIFDDSALDAPAPAGRREAATSGSPSGVSSASGIADSPGAKSDAGHLLWSGSGNLFRLDEDGDQMVEVDAGENRGALHCAVVKCSPSDQGATPIQIDLIIYSGARKRPRVKTSVAALDMQAVGEDGSAPFYDDNGIYWALQLSSTAEAVALARVLLAAKAFATGSIQSMEMKEASEEADPAGPCLSVQAKSSMYDFDDAKETELTASESLEITPAQADALWGSGVGALIEEMGLGAGLLIAVPPGLQPPAKQQRNRSGRSSTLLDFERLQSNRMASPAAAAVAAAAVQESRTKEPPAPESEMQSSARPSLKERMAKLAVAAGGAAAPPPAAALQGSALAGTSLSTRPYSGALPMDRPIHQGANTSAAQPAIYSQARDRGLPGGDAGSPPFAAMASTADPAQVSSSPTADLIRQYWAAVQQQSGFQEQVAFLGALPLVPGLSIQGRQFMQAPPATMPSMMGPAMTASAQGPSLQQTLPTPGSVASVGSATPWAERGVYLAPEPQRKAFMPDLEGGAYGSLTVGSMRTSDFLSAIREVVRSEATQEGWAAERQKLERRSSLLEEQLNAAKAHQDQLKVHVTSLHTQLAEAQQVARQAREQQLRSESDRQMRDWEQEAARNALESELRQCRNELHQLRLEERGLRERAADAQAIQHRLEEALANAQAAVAPTNAAAARAVAEAEQRLQAQATAVASLERELQREKDVSAQLRESVPKEEEMKRKEELQALSEMHSAELVRVCKNVLGITYGVTVQMLPDAPASRISSEVLIALLRSVCQQSGKAVDQQLREVRASDRIAWDVVEAAASSGLVPLMDLNENDRTQKDLKTETAQKSIEIERLRSEVSRLDAAVEAERHEREQEQLRHRAELHKQLETERREREQEQLQHRAELQEQQRRSDQSQVIDNERQREAEQQRAGRLKAEEELLQLRAQEEQWREEIALLQRREEQRHAEVDQLRRKADKEETKRRTLEEEFKSMSLLDGQRQAELESLRQKLQRLSEEQAHSVQLLGAVRVEGHEQLEEKNEEEEVDLEREQKQERGQQEEQKEQTQEQDEENGQTLRQEWEHAIISNDDHDRKNSSVRLSSTNDFIDHGIIGESDDAAMGESAADSTVSKMFSGAHDGDNHGSAESTSATWDEEVPQQPLRQRQPSQVLQDSGVYDSEEEDGSEANAEEQDADAVEQQAPIHPGPEGDQGAPSGVDVVPLTPCSANTFKLGSFNDGIEETFDRQSHEVAEQSIEAEQEDAATDQQPCDLVAGHQYSGNNEDMQEVRDKLTEELHNEQEGTVTPMAMSKRAECDEIGFSEGKAMKPAPAAPLFGDDDDEDIFLPASRRGSQGCAAKKEALPGRASEIIQDVGAEPEAAQCGEVAGEEQAEAARALQRPSTGGGHADEIPVEKAEPSIASQSWSGGDGDTDGVIAGDRPGGVTQTNPAPEASQEAALPAAVPKRASLFDEDDSDPLSVAKEAALPAAMPKRASLFDEDDSDPLSVAKESALPAAIPKRASLFDEDDSDPLSVAKARTEQLPAKRNSNAAAQAEIAVQPEEGASFGQQEAVHEQDASFGQQEELHEQEAALPAAIPKRASLFDEDDSDPLSVAKARTEQLPAKRNSNAAAQAERAVQPEEGANFGQQEEVHEQEDASFGQQEELHEQEATLPTVVPKRASLFDEDGSDPLSVAKAITQELPTKRDSNAAAQAESATQPEEGASLGQQDEWHEKEAALPAAIPKRASLFDEDDSDPLSVAKARTEQLPGKRDSNTAALAESAVQPGESVSLGQQEEAAAPSAVPKRASLFGDDDSEPRHVAKAPPAAPGRRSLFDDDDDDDDGIFARKPAQAGGMRRLTAEKPRKASLFEDDSDDAF